MASAGTPSSQRASSRRIRSSLAWPLAALGGAQIYEPLADSVRGRLSRMVADRAPATMHFRSAADGQRWLAEMDQRLARRIPDQATLETEVAAWVAARNAEAITVSWHFTKEEARQRLQWLYPHPA